MQEIKSNQQGSAMIWVVVAVIVVALGVGAYMFMGKDKSDKMTEGTKEKSSTEVKTEVKDNGAPAAATTEVKATVVGSASETPAQ